MELLLKREKSTNQSTPGTLFLNGIRECSTLEDVVRDVKIPGETAIPAGSYQVAVTYSPHFKKYLPEVLGVPNYSGVRIHTGNKAADTEGCILVGADVTAGSDPDTLSESRVAFEPLYLKLCRAVAEHEPISLKVENNG